MSARRVHPVSVVIPTLNEAEAIGAAIREIPTAYAKDIIVADGGSTDGTQDVARAAGARVIDAGRGYGRACAAGAAAADPESRVIVYLDGDGADRGDLIGEIAGPVLAGTHDFVLASRTRGAREVGSMLWHQVLAGRLAGLGIGLRYRVRYSDMCAYRAIDRAALERLSLREMTYGWNIEMQMQAARAGLRILEVPLPYRRRAGGASKVAGSLRGTLRASSKIVSTYLRVAARPRRDLT
ncbi:glycosyltransferase family 2 protein [Methylobacterium sp. NEAU K]|uniref:glycosyltransferase family 2 protein n=1 Tax=Methylobacterium sp. NEAU K TaxID=3064946 RepID=UPI002732D137|nr:glycosyltransferase family 2 protein [Methylobacterium sp. NEAU K]MDP4006583.1 glycosyltransferase family 2 protein [Methylobacterium sp. NEAU K]